MQREIILVCQQLSGWFISMSSQKANTEPSYGNANIWNKNINHFSKDVYDYHIFRIYALLKIIYSVHSVHARTLGKSNNDS